MTRRTEILDLRRGDIVWINCDPSVGVEPRKTRTCIVVSNDIANHYGQAVTIVPTQTYTKERAGRGYMVDVRKPRSQLREARVANCSMIMTYDRGRVVRREGRISGEAISEIDRALLVHLGIAQP